MFFAAVSPLRRAAILPSSCSKLMWWWGTTSGNFLVANIFQSHQSRRCIHYFLSFLSIRLIRRFFISLIFYLKSWTLSRKGPFPLVAFSIPLWFKIRRKGTWDFGESREPTWADFGREIIAAIKARASQRERVEQKISLSGGFRWTFLFKAYFQTYLR